MPLLGTRSMLVEWHFGQLCGAEAMELLAVPAGGRGRRGAARAGGWRPRRWDHRV